jgi:cytochrome c biogenesis protein CcmG/thiol:disulfide interchange protein DsbE
VIVGAIVLLGIIALFLPSSAGVGENQVAPEFSLRTYDGMTYTLSNLRGQPVVLHFWATWCVPCIREAPIFAQAWTFYGQQGVQFIGIVVEDNQQAAEGFAERYGLTYPHGADAGISAQFGVSAVPATFILDVSGLIRQRFDGMVDRDRLHTAIAFVLTP